MHLLPRGKELTMKEFFTKPTAIILTTIGRDVIAASDEIPPYENENKGEWDDVE